MSIPMLPDTAPFNAAQRAWLNGFIAGLMSVGQQSAGAAAVDGSATGPAVEDAVDEDPPWHDPALTMSQRMELAEARPMADRLMASMAQLDCGACGYVCRTYSQAIAEGGEKDLTRCAPGGAETASMLRKLVKEGPIGDGASATMTVSAKGSDQKMGPTEFDRDHPYPAPLLEVRALNGAGSDKDTRFVSLDLTGSGLSYEPGDSLGVYPHNCGEHVERIIETLELTGNEPVRASNGRLVPLWEALQHHFTVTRADSEQALMLAECAKDREQAKELRALADDDARLEQLDLYDLLVEFKSARPSPGDLARVLKGLQPRLYSISSSLKAHPNQVHLTVGVVRYELNGRPRRGVASTFFAERARIGQRVNVFIQKSHGFSIPADPKTAMIMVGPGTGIAPFRAFLQEREAIGATGHHWLFFGDQRKETDFLYAQELEAYQQRGVLHYLDTAFSRDQEQKVYVQHRMIEKGARLWKWIDAGAHLYICGDAKRMARDVEAALKRIACEHGGMSEAEASAFLSEMTKAKRYQKDVY